MEAFNGLHGVISQMIRTLHNHRWENLKSWKIPKGNICGLIRGNCRKIYLAGLRRVDVSAKIRNGHL
jgi:hypothetical protein